MITGIYKITNKINGHYYIGQSIDIKARFRGHKYSSEKINDKDHNTPIHLAIHKYGIENFELTILEECSKEELDEREVYWIKTLQSTKNGNYNILKGGQDRISLLNYMIYREDIYEQFLQPQRQQKSWEYPEVLFIKFYISIVQLVKNIK